MRIWPLLLSVSVVVGGVRAAAAVETKRFPERLTRERDGFVVDYARGDEAFADLLLKRVPEFSQAAPTVAAPRELAVLDLATLSDRQEGFLRHIAAQLAFKKPPEKMKESFGRFTQLFTLMRRIDLRMPKKFVLWRRAELQARLEAGEQVPNFKLAGKDIEFEFKFEVTGTQAEDFAKSLADFERFWEQVSAPVSIGEPNLTPEQEIEKGLRQVRELVGGVRELAGFQQVTPFIVLHEAVESTVVWHYITSKDRRWFCDGVANYVAWKALEAQIGAEAACRYYDLDAELTKFAAERHSVNLEKWPAAENLKKANYREDLNTANYAFATKAVADICAKHGDAILPKLFAEIGKTPRDKTTMKTVYKAFKKLTGEDMRRYLPKAT